MRCTLLIGLVITSPLAAQSGPSRAAATITPADVSKRIGIIAHDSMMGRDTPSRGLDLTAQYVASEFRKFGLKPLGDSGTFIQHYPLTRKRLDVAFAAHAPPSITSRTEPRSGSSRFCATRISSSSAG